MRCEEDLLPFLSDCLNIFSGFSFLWHSCSSFPYSSSNWYCSGAASMVFLFRAVASTFYVGFSMLTMNLLWIPKRNGNADARRGLSRLVAEVGATFDRFPAQPYEGSFTLHILTYNWTDFALKVDMRVDPFGGEGMEGLFAIGSKKGPTCKSLLPLLLRSLALWEASWLSFTHWISISSLRSHWLSLTFVLSPSWTLNIPFE